MPSSVVWHSTAGQEVGPVAHACSFVSSRCSAELGDISTLPSCAGTQRVMEEHCSQRYSRTKQAPNIPQQPCKTHKGLQGVRVPPSTSLNSSLVWAVTVREDGLQGAGPILPLSKGCICLGVGVQDPTFPVMPVKDP